MKFTLRPLLACALAALWLSSSAADVNPKAVSDLLNRVGGPGTSDRFVTVLDEALERNGQETFVITSSDGKPCIKGSTLSALTTGIGWYLNHHARVNLTWNDLTTDLSSVPLPLPAEETHSSAAAYRYYLNYCTFSYSMSTWTWERWQQEIDWMALRGINMPLHIIGLEEVWRKLLMEDYGYSASEANDFVGGPGFMAWFGMNNLQGWGGPNPDWWYERQADLGRKMTERMHSLGIEPVLPGFAGMVPSNFRSKTGITAMSQGNWCGFTRPYILDATSAKFADVAAKYYSRLHEVMGSSRYYSIDPFHEGGATPSNVAKAYQSLYNAMDAATPGSQFVIQSWQWSDAQRTCLDNIPKGKLLVLDLYSDGRPGWNNYKGHETVYCTIFNFGGRTGFFGRFNGIIDGYFDARKVSSVKGIGAAPEAIEQTPVMYDLLFELPWLSSKPDPAKWMADYALRRYGADSPLAAEAWELLRTSALDCRTALQGPHEAIVCSRPSLTVNNVSTWGGADIFYDRTQVIRAAYSLLDANLSGDNYSYDLADISRQALTDYSKALLDGIRQAHAAGDTELFAKRRDAFLQLILDIDRLLATNSLLTLGNWTERARAIASEVPGTTDADRDWLELDNARTLITTWGPKAASEGGGLRDYSYRQWNGMLRDFYYKRWKQWFDAGMQAPSGGWFQSDWDWAHSSPAKYSSKAVGDTRLVAAELLPKYLSRFTPAEGSPAFIDRLIGADVRGKFFDVAAPGSAYVPDIAGADIAEIAVDFSKNNRYEPSEISTSGSFPIPADAPLGERSCRVTLSDGTTFTFTLRIIAKITEPRTVTVLSANPNQGSVSIDGTDGNSLTGTDCVVIRASARGEYDFDHWEDLAGNNLGNDNPFTYYGKEDATFRAHFVVNKWGVPPTDNYADKATIEQYKQYVKTLSVTQNGEQTTLYSTTSAPESQFVQIPTRIKAAPGGEFSFNWTDAGGLRWLFLSAFVDLNGDGVFDMDRATELLGTFGEYHSNDNPQTAAGEFRVLLPFATEKGTTHIRLRFDSSWNDAAWNSAVGCFRPDGSTNRFVYEMLLEVVDAPDYACNISVRPSSAAFGSVRSENESNVYNAGEEVIMTAFPNPGCRLVGWVDNHGRALPQEWMSENQVRFTAYDNAQITALFEADPVEISGWKFGWEPMDGGLARLTSVVAEGDSHLNLAGASPQVGGIAPGLFANAGALKEVTLPERDFTGPGKVTCSVKVKGDGTRNKITAVSPTVSGSSSWVLTIKGSNTGATFNDYGSALFGNGTDCLASDYSGGWSQLYLRKDGTLDVKWDSADAVNFGEVDLLGDFTVRIAFNGSKKTADFTVSNASGMSQTMTLTNSSTMKDISQFATAIPLGIDLEFTFAKADEVIAPGTLFAGASSLFDFHCAEGSKLYTERDGIIYKRNTTRVRAYPEGRFRIPFAANDETPANPFDAYYYLKDGNFIHANSGRSSQATYEVVYGTGMPSLKITSGSEVRTFKFTDPMTVTLAADCAGYTLPMGISVPDDPAVKLALVERVDATDGPVLKDYDGTLPPATPFIVRMAPAETVTLRTCLCESDAPAALGGILKGSLTDLTADAFVNNSGRFERSSLVPANSVYLAPADVPSSLGDSFSVDFSRNSILEVGSEAEAPSARLYDLRGRRVLNPGPGIYINSIGDKILK